MKLSYRIVVIFLLTAGAVFSQAEKKLYAISETGGVSNLDVYHNALAQKDLDGYRLLDADRIVRFRSGVAIKLFSVEFLESEYGRMRNRALCNRFGNEPTYPWYWELSPSGEIIDKRIYPINP